MLFSTTEIDEAAQLTNDQELLVGLISDLIDS